MNIADMSVEQAGETMIRVSSVLAFICDDKEVQDFIGGISASKDENAVVIVQKYLPQLTNILFKRHKDSMYELISALAGIPKNDVTKMKFKDAIGVLKENWSVLKDFFTPSKAEKISTK